MLLSAVITEAEEGGFTALNPETGTTTQGETLDEAMENLKEATSLYLQEFPIIKLYFPMTQQPLIFQYKYLKAAEYQSGKLKLPETKRLVHHS